MAYRHINKKSLVLYAGIMLLVYTLTLFLPVGWGTYFAALPAYLIVGMTCLARANDLVEEGLMQDTRRFGFAIMAGMALMFILEPIGGSFPRWPRVFVMWSLALVWLTTPSLPPWWEWATGAWDHYSLKDKVLHFFRSLHGRAKEGGDP